MPRKRTTAARRKCDEVVATLERALRASNLLRSRLESRVADESRPIQLCDQLWNATIEAVRMVAVLQADICEPEYAELVRSDARPAKSRKALH